MFCFKLTVTVTHLFLFSNFAPTPSWVHAVDVDVDVDAPLAKEETTEEQRIENHSAWYQDELSSHLENGLLVLNDGACRASNILHTMPSCTKIWHFRFYAFLFYSCNLFVSLVGYAWMHIY